ncbi:MAG: prephenate dehydratase [Candidatus Helarchaeota archaeon]
MDEINEKRRKIDEINEKIAKLLDERFALVKKIGEIKNKNKIPIIDRSRERNIYEKLSKLDYKNVQFFDIKRIFEKIISVSRMVQEGSYKIAFLGPRGTFSDQAAQNYFSPNSIFIPLNSFTEIFRSVRVGEADFGVVPIENSTSGSIGLTLDLLLETDIGVCGEIIERITLCLITPKNVEKKDIEKVYSHPQPFSQSRKFLEDNLPNVELITTKSTVNAVELVKNTSNAAAIGSELAGKIHNMEILRKGIEDVPNNYTRFFVIGNYKVPETGKDKTSIAFSVKHVPGALMNALKVFAERNINLTKLESRPLKSTPWEYFFYTDFEGHIDSKICKEALKELKKYTNMVKIFGSYPI